MTDLTDLDQRLHVALTSGCGELLATVADELDRAELPTLAQVVRERGSWQARLSPKVAPLDRGDTTDRRRLATEVAAALDNLNPEDPTARTALARRIAEAGITDRMHVQELLRSGPPTKLMNYGVSLDEMRAITRENLSNAFATQLITLNWPRDKRIEYTLGQLLPGLAEGADRSRWQELGLEGMALTRYRDQLLELRDLPSDA
ncbi:hypothetical protein [Nocardia sp. NPDC052566]|uniref:hypothetical protein n=1 Tax=Nocardia sp. NPDC052566 TaxID=3364330 RepID=UPI0037C8A1A9